jgi:hypothetical protein
MVYFQAFGQVIALRLFGRILLNMAMGMLPSTCVWIGWIATLRFYVLKFIRSACDLHNRMKGISSPSPYRASLADKGCYRPRDFCSLLHPSIHVGVFESSSRPVAFAANSAESLILPTTS